MIWIDDLAILEPALLRDGLELQENDFSPEQFALALTRARTATRDYVLEHLEPAFGAAIRRALARPVVSNAENTFTAQLNVIAVYLWHIVYRKFPEEYERFVTCQRYRFDKLFPPALYTHATVVDVGCGTGKLVEHLSATAARIHAIDPMEGMLSVARRKFSSNDNVRFAIGTFRDIPLPEQSVDFVVSNMAFKFHENCGGHAGLADMKRVLRRGGEIRLTVENAHTQDFLLANGFTEDFVPRGLRYVGPPNDASPLLRILVRVAQQGMASHAGANRAQARWRLRWTISNLLALAGGEAWDSMFHGGSLIAPIGVASYRWTKP
jgi:ubiquinone/menaquinone biosynthesis C-methylase UbiE